MNKIEVDPKTYDAITDRIAKIIANLKIHGLNGHVELDTTGRIPTACWSKNNKTGDFVIKLGYELLAKLNDEETLGVIEHELLHHVHYRNCDIRNPLMSNIVLDTAINKILYLCNPSVTEGWANKVYGDEELEKMFKGAMILVCPHLDADQIDRISDPKIRQAYIEVWGSRKTTHDFNTEVPVPLSLYYKLAQFIDKDEPQDNPFGESDDSESEDGEGEDGEDSEDAQSDEQNGKSTKSKGKSSKSKQRCKDDEGSDQDEDQESSTGSGQNDDQQESDDESSSGQSDDSKDSEETEDKDQSDGKGNEEQDESEDKDQAGGKDQQEDADDEDADGNDDESDGQDDEEGEGDEAGGDDEEPGYSEVDPLEQFLEDKLNEAGQAGKGKSPISFTFAPPVEIDSEDVLKRLKERIFEQTIDEIGDIIAGSLHNNVTRQPYVVRPTRTTLTHMACGVTDYLPVYYNETPGQGRPKVGCYVDVSGSMDHHMRLVHSIMIRIGEFMPSMSFVFSNDVMPLPTLAWNKVIPLGGGTSFDSVFEHICLPRETKQQWLDQWIQNNAGSNRSRYNSYGSLTNQIMQYIEEIGVQGDFLSEDLPVIFLITDGEDQVSNSLQEKFRNTGKKLVVLLLTESVQTQHAFNRLDATVIQINSRAEIIDRGID
jgi:hypothetical protein